MAPIIEKIHEIPPLELGEGPHWDDKNQVLYLVDILGHKVVKYSAKQGSYDEIETGDNMIGFVIPVKGEQETFVAGMGLDIKLVQWDTSKKQIKRLETLVTVPESGTMINDGKCDPSGRLWFGTLSSSLNIFEKNVGSLYSFSKTEGLKKHESGITLSNGLAFTKDQKVMYYIDSDKKKVGKYSLDIKNAKIEPIGTAFDTEQYHKDALPDGMTIDANDNLWVAIFGASQVLNIDAKTKKILQTVNIPLANQTTSVAFGGPNFDELYVTTGNFHKHRKEEATNSGCTFRVKNLEVKGLPAAEFDLNA